MTLAQQVFGAPQSFLFRLLLITRSTALVGIEPTTSGVYPPLPP
jgi:hypothetical protein